MKFKAEVERDNEGDYRVGIVVVEPKVDRPRTYGFLIGGKKTRLKDRLVRAIEAGAVMPNPVVKEDKNGKTYVSHGIAVLGRTLNADLKRLGY